MIYDLLNSDSLLRSCRKSLFKARYLAICIRQKISANQIPHTWIIRGVPPQEISLTQTWRILFLCPWRHLVFILMVAAPSLNVAAEEFSRHKLLASYMFNSISRTTLTRNESYAAPIGYAIEYSMFLGKNLALTGQFNLSLEPVAQSVFFMGGGAALSWYIMGGANTNYSDDYFQISSEPGFNLIFVGGMAARQFDFSSSDQRLIETTGEPIIYDKRDKPSNSFFGPLFGLGVELPVGFFLTPGFRVQIINSFESTDSPSITSLEIWVYSAFVL